MPTVPVEDRLEIQALTNCYSLYVDTKEPVRVVELFADDAVFDQALVNLPGAHGRDALRALYEGGVQGVEYSAHYVTNHVIREFDGHVATGACYVLAVARLYDGRDVRIWGYYDDVYVKQRDGWRFKSRRVVPLMPAEIPTSLAGELSKER
jgi:ketosteroid isomerase-like protein